MWLLFREYKFEKPFRSFVQKIKRTVWGFMLEKLKKEGEKSWNSVCCVCVTCSVGSGALEKEEEFVQKCMESLSAASSQLDQVSDDEQTILWHFLFTFLSN